ncbi:MAG: response regulator, partial [Planctomycetota bacterium]|nr:response regulator [Planctomycetota bacterium]
MREGNAEILIVDNDDRIVELVAWFLKKRGFVVRTASSFAQARERIAEHRPDLMLSDIDLGAESAIEELPRLDACGNLPPTLVVSGYLDPGIEEELASLGPVLDTL